jgi:hypothetical protein
MSLEIKLGRVDKT